MDTRLISVCLAGLLSPVLMSCTPEERIDSGRPQTPGPENVDLQTGAPAGFPYWGQYQKDHAVIRPQRWFPEDHTIVGWDWSLPENTEVSPRSLLTVARISSLNAKVPGLAGMNFDMNPVCEMWITWEEIEPEQGKYRWDSVKGKIQELERAGFDVIFRPLFHAKMRGEDPNDWGYTPQWLDDMDLPYIPADGSGANLAYYDPSDPTFHSLYLKVINSMKDSGIPDLVKAAYVGYGSHTHGDEGIGPEGQDPDTVQHVLENLDAWADAFEGQTYKVYMGGESDYGFEKGFGIRAGFVENYWYRLPSPPIGQYVDADGYLKVNESEPIIANNSFNGEENEEYGGIGDGRFGTTLDSFPYRYFMSTLRLLQMRTNALLAGTSHLLPFMLPFVSQEMGRTVEDTPDVWSFLCEAYIRATTFTQDGLEPPYYRPFDSFEQKNGVAVKNMERWLHQRDKEGYETTPVIRIDYTKNMWMMAPDKHFDYIARQGKKIGFMADERFAPTGRKSVKVTYIDNTAGELVLRYRDSSGQEKTKSVKLLGDDYLRTATFILDDMDLSSAGSEEFDFTVEAGEGTESVTVSMVRVIKC